MDIATSFNAEPPVLVEYIRMPDEIVSGRFNARGEEDPEGNLFITVKDTSFIWAVFTQTLMAGQRGDMIFSGVPGTFLVGSAFTEWDPAADEPYVGEGLFALISAERGEGMVRVVGRNAGSADLPAAVGIVVADDASYKPHR